MLTAEEETDLFEVVARIRQGDIFALYHFVIALDSGMPQAIKGKKSNFGFELEKWRSRRHPIVSIFNIDLADNIVIKSIHKIQKLLKGVRQESARMLLQANGKKTKVIAYSLELLTNISSKS